MQTKPISAQPVDRTGRWLASLTRWVLAHKRLVAVGWLALTLVGFYGAAKVTDALNENFTMPDSASTITNERIVSRFDSGGATPPLVAVVNETLARQSFGEANRYVDIGSVRDHRKIVTATPQRRFADRDRRRRFVAQLLPDPRIAVERNVLVVEDRVGVSDRGKRYDLEDYLELNRVAGLLVLKEGRVKLERYRFGNSERTRWMSMSIAKSITSTLIGAAVKQGHIASLSDPVTRYVPSLAGSAYESVSVRDG